MRYQNGFYQVRFRDQQARLYPGNGKRSYARHDRVNPLRLMGGKAWQEPLQVLQGLSGFYSFMRG